MWLETSVTTRLPSTGPIVQNAIAAARPTCGEKSRIKAGVALGGPPPRSPARSTRRTPPCPTLRHREVTSKPVSSSPPTTRFARPHRSASPAASDADAPNVAPIATIPTNSVKLK